MRNMNKVDILYDGSTYGWKNKETASKNGEIYSREEVIEMSQPPGHTANALEVGACKSSD